MPASGYIHVQIGGEDIDLALLAEVEIQQTLNDHWTATVAFRSAPDAQPDVSAMLNQALTVSAYDLLGAQHTLFDGLVSSGELIYEVTGSFGARIEAMSYSWLMDLSGRYAYFLKQTPDSIAQTLAGNYGLAFKGSIRGDGNLSRVQWKESDWRFLLRMVDDGEAWLRPTWEGLETQTSFQPGTKLVWRHGEYDLMEFAGGSVIQPLLQGGSHYDDQGMQSQSYNGITSEAAFYGPWESLVANTLKASEATPQNQAIDRHRTTTLASYQQRLQMESRRRAVNAGFYKGISRNPEVMAGNEVTISGLDPTADGTYGVVACVHRWTPRGYENHFQATTAKRWFAPERPPVPRAVGLFPARVVANYDPHNMGRLQVQFYWQEENATTWAPLLTAHAGADRGMLFFPEIGDEVMVRFEEGDPERPVVLGCVWNGIQQPPAEGFWTPGEKNGSEFAQNQIKRIVTKSGNRITFSDKPGQASIALSTPQGNKILLTEKANETGRPAMVLHSEGDILLSAPNGRVHVHSATHSKDVGDKGDAVAKNVKEKQPAPTTAKAVTQASMLDPDPIYWTRYGKSPTSCTKAEVPDHRIMSKNQPKTDQEGIPGGPEYKNVNPQNSLTSFSNWDKAGMSQSYQCIFKGIAHNETKGPGYFDSVMSYDSAVLTAGAAQNTVSRDDDGGGDLEKELARFRDNYPDKYKTLFADKGWTVQGDEDSAIAYFKDPDQPQMQPLHGKTLRSYIRQCDGANFHKTMDPWRAAGSDPDLQNQQVKDFNKRINIVRNNKVLGSSYRYGDFITSSRGMAQLVDEDVNYPFGLSHDFGKAVQQFYKDNPDVSQDPTKWTEEQRASYETSIMSSYHLFRGKTYPGKPATMVNEQDRWDSLSSSSCLSGSPGSVNQ